MNFILFYFMWFFFFFWSDSYIEDIQESSAFSYIPDCLCGHSTSHCCYLCRGTQTLCLENWL